MTGAFICRAAARGHANLLELLLRRGADVRTLDCQGRTALHQVLCPWTDHNTSQDCLHFSGAVWTCRDDSKVVSPASLLKYCGTCAHVQACRFGHTAAARVLVQAARAQGSGGVVDALDGEGFACLHNAAQWGHEQVARSLIATTLDTHASNLKRVVAADLCASVHIVVDRQNLLMHVELHAGLRRDRLHECWLCSHAGCVMCLGQVARELLVEGNADTGVLSQPEGLSALHLAARWGHVPLLRLLMAHLQPPTEGALSADRSATDARALLQDKSTVAQVILQHKTGEGMKPLLRLRSSKGNTAADEARIWGRDSCAEFLEQLSNTID